MPCCGGQSLAYLRREVPDGRGVCLRAEHAHNVAHVADAARGGESDGRFQCLPPDGRCLLWSALGGVGGGG
jgi:hypothetical protein